MTIFICCLVVAWTGMVAFVSYLVGLGAGDRLVNHIQGQRRAALHDAAFYRSLAVGSPYTKPSDESRA